MKTIRMRRAQLFAFAKRAGGFFLKSHILTIWIGLCALGFFIGTQTRPDPSRIPYDEIFENLRVISYREAPSDTAARFVVELSARGKPFRQYDVDARRFLPATTTHEYWRSINGTSYEPLQVRGHLDRGVWLELPDSSATSLVPEQFDELYSSTLDLVNPISMATSVLGMLSGYSVGYRLATWGHSMSSHDVQDRILSTPGFGRLVAREAWRRVALEPAVVFPEKNSGRFVTVSGRQRLYTNFFKLAVDDSNGFIPYEAARLESAGAFRESRAMVDFATAVRRAAQDTCDLTSADFRAVEEWASLLDRRGHWAVGSIPPPGAERIRHLGALAWYGLAPETAADRRLWIGPRMIVRNGDAEGFVADEIPRIEAACPVAWREWLGADETHLGSNEWTARWMGEARQFAPILDLGRNVVGVMSRKSAGTAVAGARDSRKPGAGARTATPATSAFAALPPDPAPPSGGADDDARHAARRDSLAADSSSFITERSDPDATVIRSRLGAIGP